uniref:Phosphoinositide phospholipase C n=1 Tax=Scleropages formosus TaxID=113540 RepID=A0A8C9TDF2_SCLFO
SVFVVTVEKCMNSMQTGTQMVKLRGGSKGLVRFFYLDEHKSCIRWRPSRKNEKAKISIDSIREVCEGKQSEIFQRYADGSFDPNCCFSIYYGEHMESLDLVSSSGEEARTWITGLKYLVAGISDEDSLAKRQRTPPTWLKQTFSEADKNGDGSLSISEVLQLLHKLNVNLPRQKVKQMFKEADTDENQGTLGFEEFCTFYKMMSTRRDLYLLMLTYSNHKDHLDTDDLVRFLEIEQKMTSVSKEHCLEIVNKFEPCPENRTQGVLGIDGFTNYMRSPAGDIFNPEHYEVNQDMMQPLCNYFIASSHNTYLTGDQLMSQSRVDMYSWVLQSGCRCVEVDCWDGQDGEPIVHHGYTLTSKILFKDVVETINKYAFIKNLYPVILSIENHCSVPQQKKMAQYLVEILGDKLDLSDVQMDESGRLPSPESLKGKILVKGKKLPANIDENAEEGDVSDEDSADEMDDDCKLMNGDVRPKQVESVAKKKLDTLMKESKIRDREDPDNFTVAATVLLLLLWRHCDRLLISVLDALSPLCAFMQKKTAKLKKASSFEDTDTDQESSGMTRVGLCLLRKKKTMKLSRALSDLVKYTKSVGVHDIETQGEVSSLSETKAHQLIQQKPSQFVHFNQRQLSRIYPSSYRVDSSNYNPQPFWNTGCHLVALNYQTEGRVLQLNRAKFYSNGNCGYILKPKCMCEGAFSPMVEDPLPTRLKKQLVLKIISGQQLPKPKDSMLGDRGEIIDPFVEVEIIGLPVDCCKEQTRVVDDNGFNPMWEETLVFTLHMPEVALVRFLVWDHDPIGQDFIGQRTIAFTSMMPGYRHVYLEGMEEASIFVHVAVNDITGKVRPASGIKGLFHRNPKQASLDSHAAAQLGRKSTFGAHLLRRTASAPTKGQSKAKKGFPEISIDTKDYSSEGTSEDRDAEEAARPRCGREGDSPAAGPRDCTNGDVPPGGSKGKGPSSHKGTLSEPLRRANRLRLQDPLTEKQGVFARVAIPHRSISTSGPASASPRHSTPGSPPSSTATSASPSPAQNTGRESEEPKRRLFMLRTLSLPTEPVLCNTVEACGKTTADCNGEVASTSMDESVLSNHVCLTKGVPVGHPAHDDNVSKTGKKVGQTPDLKAVFSCKGGRHVPVRRTKSEGYARAERPVPQVCIDATINDRLWSKLDHGDHRDSVSSSSSISSSDTVIDLSLPNLARKGLSDLDMPKEVFAAGKPDRPQSAAVAIEFSTQLVSKSKSNPNLRADGAGDMEDELQPRPLGKEQPSPARITQRRHTWSRLYMEGLKQSSTRVKKTPLPAPADSSKSKSLGDLTSDDITCNFDSKYRSISRSFVMRPTRDKRGAPRAGPDDLAERLRQLTDVEPLTPSDFLSTPDADADGDVVQLRRSSSRSQSRVRYIANRAKQAQERQRLQAMARLGGSPIEERGNPEGACTVARSPCAGLDLLSQLPSTPPQQASSALDTELRFTLKL